MTARLLALAVLGLLSMQGCASSGGGGAQQGTAADPVPWRTLTCRSCRTPVQVLELPTVFLGPAVFRCGDCLQNKPADRAPRGMLDDPKPLPF